MESEARVLFPLGVTFFTGFLFSRSKASAVNIGIIAILVHFEKTLIANYPGAFLWHS